MGFQDGLEFNPGYGWGDAFLLLIALIVTVKFACHVVYPIIANAHREQVEKELVQRNTQAEQERERLINTYDELSRVRTRRVHDGSIKRPTVKG